MLIYLQMEPKWSQNRIKSIQTNSTHSDHETSIFQHSGPTEGGPIKVILLNTPSIKWREECSVFCTVLSNNSRGDN